MTGLALLPAPKRLSPVLDINATNFANPARPGIEANKLLNNTGSTGTAQAFAIPGLFPCTVGEGQAVTLDACRRNWLLNAARVNFYSDWSATTGNLVSSVTAGVTLSSDLRTLTFTGAAVPVGAVCWSTNTKFGQGPSNAYASTNVIEDGAMDDLTSKIVVNRGASAACLVPFGQAGTEDIVTEPADFSESDFGFLRHGFKMFTRHHWGDGKHIVSRMETAPSTVDFNGDFQFLSWTLIDEATPLALTPGAFAAAFSATGSNATTLYVESDNAPAYKQFDVFMGAAHGPPCTRATATGHPLTKVDEGQIRLGPDGKQYIVALINSPSVVTLARVPTGTDTDWNYDTNVGPTGTYAHVSGGTHTADLVVTAVAPTQLYPSNQNVSVSLRLEGGRKIENSGAYAAKLLRATIKYRVPNLKNMLDYIVANVGSPDGIDYNGPDVASSLDEHIEYLRDPWTTTIFHQTTALMDHHCNFSWPMQWQKINARASASETLNLLIPATKSLASGVSQAGGTPLDFSSWVNVTANALEYYMVDGSWQDASYWKDGQKRAPAVAAFAVKDSGGTILRKWVMALDREQGHTAARDYCSPNWFFSAANKMYAPVLHEVDRLAGDPPVMSVAAAGWRRGDWDASADLNFDYPKGDGRYGFEWWAPGALVGHLIPVKPHLVGKRLRVICESTTCTVTEGVISAEGIPVTTTGKGGFSGVIE